MRIGIDGRELLGKRTGVGRYLAALCREWATSAAGHEFLIYLPAPVETAPAEVQHLVARGGGRLDVRVVPGRASTAWEQFRLPAVANRDRLDVFFAPAYSAPLALRCPVVVAMHDVSFAAHPEWFSWREGLRRRWLARRAARRARTVLTFSEFSRSELVRHLGLDDAAVRVIPHGIVPPPVRGGEREPLVLFVGSIFNRRRVPDLIEAFASVVRSVPEAQLAIVGENRTYPPQDLGGLVRRLGLSERARLLSYVPDGELAALYGRARVFAFPSEYEGFGFTPLEALAAGVPPVLADTPVARETCGEAACYVRRGDVDALACALATLLRDERARAAVLARAPAVLARYSWARAARETLTVLLDAAAFPR